MINLPVFVGMTALGFAAYMAWRAWQSLGLARSSLRWSTVEGKLARLEVVQFKATSSHRTLFVDYSYWVDGERLQGSTDAFYTLSADEVERFASGHERGGKVRVYLNRDRPQQSVLIPGPHPSKPYSDLILAGVAIVVSIGVVLAGFFGWIA